VGVVHGEGRMPDGRKVTFTTVPYFAWQNRGAHALATWLTENRKLIKPEKPPSKKPMNTDG
jgi:hypothetical protein